MTTNAVGNDEWIGIDNISITGTPLGADLAPTVASTAPADGGTAQKTDNIVITFSEPVTVEETWFSISCTTSGTHTATVTDENPVFTLDPDENFHVGETCAVTVLAENVTDDDLIDPPDAMVADHTFSFTIARAAATHLPVSTISRVQAKPHHWLVRLSLPKAWW